MTNRELRRRFIGALVVLVVVVTAIHSSAATAQEPTEAARIRIARRLALSTVSIDAAGVRGSGFVVGTERWIVTRYHVVEDVVRDAVAGEELVSVRFGSGTTRRARVLRIDVEHDLAILEVDGGHVPAPPLELGDSDRVMVGGHVLALGTPLGDPDTLTQGTVTARRDLPVMHGRTGHRLLLEINAAIGPGPGGPVVNTDGRVIGVSTASEPDGEVHYAAPANYVRDFLAGIRRSRAAAPPLGSADLGVVVEDARTASALGVHVIRVLPGSPAQRAGVIGATDVLVAVDGHTVRTRAELDAYLATCTPGQSLQLSLRESNGSTSEVTATLDALP